MADENRFEWQIITSIIIRARGTKSCSWDRDTGTSSSPKAALEVAMIRNSLYFSGVRVL